MPCEAGSEAKPEKLSAPPTKGEARSDTATRSEAKGCGVKFTYPVALFPLLFAEMRGIGQAEGVLSGFLSTPGAALLSSDIARKQRRQRVVAFLVGAKRVYARHIKTCV